MRKMKCFVGLLLIFWLFSPCLLSQQQNKLGFFQNTVIKPALRAEYFGLSLKGDDKTDTSNFKSFLFTMDTEFEVLDGLSVHLLLGYSLSNFEGLTFRDLPFSVQMDVGQLGGFVLGTEVDKKLIRFPDYELNLNGQLIYSFRFWKNSWEVPDLNVEGTVTGSPTWLRAQIGPLIRYLGFDYISPYISIKYNKLWGRYKMEQEIQELTGLEKKKFKSTNNYILMIGVNYEMTDFLLFTGEVTVYPYSDGTDLGAMVYLRLNF